LLLSIVITDGDLGNRQLTVQRHIDCGTVHRADTGFGAILVRNVRIWPGSYHSIHIRRYLLS
jgi:hypothetical protein